MSQLIIIGASALGREAYTYAKMCGITVKGFLDSRSSILDDYIGYPPILGSVCSYEPGPDDVFVCAVGDVNPRRRYVQEIIGKGGSFVTLLHPSVVIGDNVRIGIGCIIAPCSFISNDTMIGDHVIIGAQSAVTHDCQIGDFVTISPGCHIAGWCTLHNMVFCGVHSAIIPHVTIGENAFIAAGAVVVANVASGRVMGVPAKAK